MGNAAMSQIVGCRHTPSNDAGVAVRPVADAR